MSSRYYILDKDKKAIPCDLMTLAKWVEDGMKEKIVRQQTVNDLFISTVFIGLDHSHDDKYVHIFETMVFKGIKDYTDIYCDRYATYKEALAGHKKAVQWVKDGCKDET